MRWILTIGVVVLAGIVFMAKQNKPARNTDAPKGPVIILSDNDFDEKVLNHKGVFLVDFYADWCPPCRMQAPVIDELSSEFEGRVAFGKINVDSNRGKPQEYSVRSIPTLVIFKDGKVAERLTGFQSKEILKAKLDRLI